MVAGASEKVLASATAFPRCPSRHLPPRLRVVVFLRKAHLGTAYNNENSREALPPGFLCATSTDKEFESGLRSVGVFPLTD